MRPIPEHLLRFDLADSWVNLFNRKHEIELPQVYDLVVLLLHRDHRQEGVVRVDQFEGPQHHECCKKDAHQRAYRRSDSRFESRVILEGELNTLPKHVQIDKAFVASLHKHLFLINNRIKK